MFKEVAESFEEVFASPAWTAYNLQAYPSNYMPTEPKPSEYVVLEVLPGQPIDIQYGYGDQLGGMFIVQIYTEVNKGVRRAFEIGDWLRELFQRQLLTLTDGTLQTSSSYLDVKGNDPDDPSLFRADFSVNFKAFR